MALVVPVPKLSQITSYLSSEKIRTFGRLTDITLLSLRIATAPYQRIPTDPDEGYVLDAIFDDSNELQGKFCIVWSTKRMSTAGIGEIIHSDCTYKCAWNGYPITMVGFSDKNRKFHPVVLAVSTFETHLEFAFILNSWKKVNQGLNPKYLMADASEAVFNGAKTIWPTAKRLMCYAHVYMVSFKNSLYSFHGFRLYESYDAYVIFLTFDFLHLFVFSFFKNHKNKKV